MNLQKEIVDRMPVKRAKDTVILKTSRFYLNNRKMFLSNFNKIFKNYKKEIREEDTENISCDSRIDNRDLFIHQKIVRDYLNLHTPYRGLLLYHGLGSGKTCTSIAIAEGIKTQNRIFIMTPASLKTNYFSELKKCGDDLYKKKQYWEFVATDGQPEYLNILKEALSLPEEYIVRNGGAWLVNVKKEQNFDKLTGEEQKQIDEQLNAMIRTKYTDINYNGMNREKIRILTDDFTKNPFDHSVVIVDEAHNFVSRIVNALKKVSKKKKTGVAEMTGATDTMETININIMLYEYLLSAKNTRVVFLSGTPIINYPNEIAVTYNMLRGYIKTWNFQLEVGTTGKMNKEHILELFEKSKFHVYDYVEYSGNNLTITRNPFGFVNDTSLAKTRKKTDAPGEPKNPTKTRKQPHEGTVRTKIGGGDNDIESNYKGVYLDSTGNISDAEFERIVRGILSKNQITVRQRSTITNNKCLPDDEDEFFNIFISTEDMTMKNVDTFKRRVLGLTSYFRSSQEKLLPRFVMNHEDDEDDDDDDHEETVFHMVYCPMSEHQFTQYISIRETEILREQQNRKQTAANNKKGVFIENNTYRIYSRTACNFVFPDPPGRPLPSKKIVNEDDEEDAGNAEDEVEVENAEGVVNGEYAARIQQAMNEIDTPDILSNDGEDGENLSMYSPKFSNFLNIFGDEEENRGCHLLYSNFRTIEGIGVLRLALLKNGYEEFKIKKTVNGGNWEIFGDLSNTHTSKRFVLYTGTETAEEKEIIRNIYNGDWDIVPFSITQTLKNLGYSNNMFGEVIRLFMITASGSEGINLKNTRFVHVIEPYWNMTRVEQIIGRARRICSHSALPVELRTVKVFMYISVFDKNTNQIKDINDNVNFRNNDTSKLVKDKILTTDEYLLEISNIKNKINTQILKALKETSMDCQLYEETNKKENLKCYDGYGTVKSNNFGTHPDIQTDLGERPEQNVQEKKMQVRKITIKGHAYKLNVQTNEIYEPDNLNEPVGRIEKNGKNYIVKEI